MVALRDAGISKQQFLTVWSTNADIGFTPAQLLAAGISIAEMQSNNITLSQIYDGGVIISYLLGTGMTIAQLRTGGIPDYILINEACNIPLSVGTSPRPTIKLLSTNLNATNTQVVLEGRSSGDSLIWSITGFTGSIFYTVMSSVNDTQMLGGAIGRLLQQTPTSYVSTLSIPLPYVFSNLTVSVTDSLTCIYQHPAMPWQMTKRAFNYRASLKNKGAANCETKFFPLQGRKNKE